MKSNIKDEALRELGEKLKQAREQLKLTQEDVASKTGMTANYYAMIERGEVNLTFDKIRKLFKLLNLEPSELPL